MRLTALFLFAACLEVQAHGYSQGKLTLAEKDAPLPKVFQAIERQSDYHFFYDYPLLQGAGTVNVNVKDASLDEVLKICFKGQGFTYSIVGKMVTVVENKGAVAPAPGSGVPGVIAEFKGRVTNDAGEPLQGATVEVQGAKMGTFTDERGGFTFKNISSDAVLEISFTGYQKTAVKVAGAGSLGIVLKVATNQLDQVQIIAYGTTTERLNTGDVSTVSSKDIEEQPVSNPLAALEGRVPGLSITQSSGNPGSAFTVRIRGQNSIANGNDPFYVIDGVPYSSEMLANFNSVAGGGNPLNFINPADIERIDVLKDADATAIYGSQAANGAILITTKSGKAGKAKVDFNVYSGIGHITRMVDYLNTQQYLQMRHEAFSHDGVSPTVSNAPDLLEWDTTRYTDWQKLLIGGTSQYTDAQGSVSGGNINTQYLIGGGFHRETSVMPGSGANQKGSAHFQIKGTSLNQRFKASLSGNYVLDMNTLGVEDFTSMLSLLPPDAPPIYNPDGTLNWANSSWPRDDNPFAYLLEKYKSTTSNLVSNAVLSYQVLRGLEVKTSLGYTNMQVNEVETQPTTFYDPAQNVTSGNGYFNTSYISSWIVEPQANYKLKLMQGILNLLAGTTIQQNTTIGQEVYGSGYNSDALLADIQAAGSIFSGTTTNAQYKYNAAFGRLNYNWQDKYLLNLTVRRDGSSRFGPGKQFANFGAVGAGWVFSKENFIQQNLPFLSFGKLRGSYGTTGNDQIGDYRFLDLYSPTSYPYEGTPGMYPASLFNPDLAWEVTRKLEGGLELGFLKDVITLDASYYRNRSSNQLVSYALSAVTGFTSIAANLPAVVQNSGLEFTLNTMNVETKNFTWTSSINLTVPSNKLVSYPNFSTSPYANTYILGKAITIRRLIHTVGVNDTTGLYQFTSAKGALTEAPSRPGDYTTYVNTAPKFYGGFQNTFEYRGIALTFLFQFVKQTGENYFGLNGIAPGYEGNYPVAFLNRWQKSGDNKPYQKLTEAHGSAYTTWSDAAYYSDKGYSDASFIRLKNLSLAYSLPERWKQKMRIQNCRIYIQGQNLLTFTRYMGNDPENQSNSSLPPLRVLTAGIQLTL